MTGGGFVKTQLSNGLTVLVKPDHFKRVALRLVTLLGDRDQLAAIKETARGQAHQTFSLHRHTNQHTRLYENVLNGRLPGEGVTESTEHLQIPG